MEFEDLKKHDGEKFKLLGKTFELVIEGDLAGEWAILSCQDADVDIWATLNYEIRGIPVSIRQRSSCEVIDYDAYEGEVKNWSHYLQIVEQIASKLIKKNKVLQQLFK